MVDAVRVMLATFPMQLAVVRPSAVFTEWSLVDAAPRMEHVTARADYPRLAAEWAVLPRVVQRGPRPLAHLAGAADALPVLRRPEGWCVALPAGARTSVRVVSTVLRPLERPRLFRTRWPQVVSEGASSRQLAVVPRALLEGPVEGWTCPQEPADEVPCVTRLDHPGPLLRQLPALPSSRASGIAAVVATALAFTAALRRGERRLERFAGAAGGATVGFALALALVGASVVGWGVALAVAVPSGVALGVLAEASPQGRLAGALALAVLPLAAVTGSSFGALLGGAALVAVAAISGLGTAPRGAPEASPGAAPLR